MNLGKELKQYEEAVTAEKWAVVEYTKAKYKYDVKVANLIAKNYADGIFMGKNAEERKRNEMLLVDEKLGKDRDALQHKLESQLSAKFAAELALQRLKTLRAYLYSKSSIKNL